MSDGKIIRLITQLHSATNTGSIAWKETEKSNAYQVSFSEYSIRIELRRSRKDAESPEYFVCILNPLGDVIEEVGDEDYEGTFNLLRDMFESARRVALGVDAALDSILGELNGAPPKTKNPLAR